MTNNYYLCVAENDKISEVNKLTPSRMLDLFRYLIKEFGDENYDSVVDMLNYWPVDFSLKYKRPVQTLYITRNDNKTSEIGYIVYAGSAEKAKQTMQNYLEKRD